MPAYCVLIFSLLPTDLIHDLVNNEQDHGEESQYRSPQHEAEQSPDI